MLEEGSAALVVSYVPQRAGGFGQSLEGLLLLYGRL